MEVYKVWPEIYLNTKISWIKHNTNHATLFLDYHKLLSHTGPFSNRKTLISFFVWKAKSSFCIITADGCPTSGTMVSPPNSGGNLVSKNIFERVGIFLF